MKFENQANYYPTLSESLKDPRRKSIFESKIDRMESLETILFDTYSVNKVYIIDEFFDKDLFSLSKMPLYWEMSQRQFEAFVDAREAEFLAEDFDMHISTKSSLFHYNNGFWQSESSKIMKKELFKNGKKILDIGGR